MFFASVACIVQCTRTEFGWSSDIRNMLPDLKPKQISAYMSHISRKGLIYCMHDDGEFDDLIRMTQKGKDLALQALKEGWKPELTFNLTVSDVENMDVESSLYS